MNEDKKRIELELRKGVSLYHISTSLDYSVEFQDEAKKMLKENIQGLRAVKETEK